MDVFKSSVVHRLYTNQGHAMILFCTNIKIILKYLFPSDSVFRKLATPEILNTFLKKQFCHSR